MDPVIILVSCLFVAALVSWRLLIGSFHEQRHERSASASSTPMLGGQSAADDGAGYEAVSISISVAPCNAARAMRGQTFLVDEAPTLPLEKCDRACNCKFKSHSDRRVSSDRRYPDEDYVKVAAHAAHTERRAGRDRRRKGRFQYNGIY